MRSISTDQHLYATIQGTGCYRGSIAWLENSLRSISVRGYPGNKGVSCDPIPNHAATLDAIIKRLDSNATDTQLRHLAAQAKKSGISA